MDLSRVEKLPSRAKVRQLVTSRYPDNIRPASWDDRREGVDVVKTEDNRYIKLSSDGGQSPPNPGWIIMLTGGDFQTGYTWTLYGLEPKSQQTH